MRSLRVPDTNASRGEPLAEPSPVYYWVDHTANHTSNTGMQRVTRLLARELASLPVTLVFVCWDSAQGTLRRASTTELQTLALHSGPDVQSHPAWLTDAGKAMQPAELKGRWILVPEVTHITYHARPLTNSILSLAARYAMRTAWIFYDAVPLRSPGYEAVAAVHRDYMSELQKADVVLAISEFSGNALREFWGPGAAGEGKIRVIPLAGEFPASPRVTEVRDVEGPLRILSVGSIEPRKNHIRMLTAFERLCQEDPSLDVILELAGNITGDLHGKVSEIMRRNPRVRYHGYVRDDQLAGYYRNAAFTVFPSLEEGFGLPILESLWNGTPCICANFGAMAEVATGGGCVPVDTHFAAEIHDAMRELIRSPALRRELAEAATHRPAKLWSDYAREVAEAIGVAAN